MIGRIILGFIIAALGATMVIKTHPFVEFFGRFEWAEKHFGPTGTFLFVKLLGILTTFIGFLYVTNLHSRFIYFFLGFTGPK